MTTLWANPASELYFQGMQAYELQDYKKSIKIFKKILKKFPNTTDLGRVQAQLGMAYEAIRKYKKAVDAYDIIFKKYLSYENPESLLEREFKIAEKYARGDMKSFLGIDFASSKKTAVDIFERVVKNAPFGSYAEKAMLNVIRILLDEKKYEDMEIKIKLFKKTYQGSSDLDEVLYLDAYAYYLQSKHEDYDQTKTQEAIAKFDSYLEKFPQGQFYEKAAQNSRELKDKENEQNFKTAAFYLKQQNIPAAEKYLEKICQKFPNTEWADRATIELAEIKKGKA
jgi:outer membrane protein assembly factor BamD